MYEFMCIKSIALCLAIKYEQNTKWKVILNTIYDYNTISFLLFAQKQKQQNKKNYHTNQSNWNL